MTESFTNFGVNGENERKQDKENITIANYQQLAMRTCLPSCKNEDYAEYGYQSEVFELHSKIWGYKAKKVRGDSEEKLAEIERGIIDEIGDCFWFLALKCSLGRMSFEKIYKAKHKDLKGAEIAIKACIDALISFSKHWETLPLTCMRANIKKLSSRAERGVLKGNGDSR